MKKQPNTNEFPVAPDPMIFFVDNNTESFNEVKRDNNDGYIEVPERN